MLMGQESRENKLLKIWNEKGCVLNGWLAIPNSYSAEIMAHQNFDSLTIDMQHGPIDFQSAIEMLQAISTTDIVPLARVPWNEPSIAMRLLDAGCLGLICPMINNRFEAENFVKACYYPPIGIRSYGPNRIRLYAGRDYVANANDQTVTLAMIETSSALENLDDILLTPNLVGVYIGPADLSFNLGREPKVDPTDSLVLDTIDRILDTAKSQGRVTGIHTGSVEGAQRMIEKGFQFVTLSSDANILSSAVGESISRIRGKMGSQPGTIY